ncbi:uncharacterized protein BO95DRAFT_448017 [Aspergillus brunneoviolaceus CBS 621.78]|uniref:Uncharacterized protein n=1 Tax=Aspergillus brunneoviolaceus CBS 621.78 TaxID=1450534 RepID=A0ACD1FTM4_9EURO|nr:hypothetical protein BO95DRAFT_448017 [Aspergillus brunneoviolaceus CBS 621.78]RAH40313.1 hypothetical protein BO95DRAFT_448017 [Aspergillus brunneoviolaceus CBS 621.78]
MTSSLSRDLEKLNLGGGARRPPPPSKGSKNLRPQRKKGKAAIEPFRFFDLPSEIRLRVYHYVLFTPKRRRTVRAAGSVGASSKKNPPLAPASHRIALFLASRRLHDEAADYFYSTQVFRLFHLQDYSKMPTVRAIAPQYRPSIATIELILGSSWTDPPTAWRVTPSLGLEEMVRIRTLKVFLEVDPSHPVFEGFRISRDFYTNFSGNILHEVLARLPNLEYVEFDAWPSVRKSGGLMKRLLHEARAARKKIAWGPDRGWTDYDGEEFDEDAYGLKAQEAKAEEHRAQQLARLKAMMPAGFMPETLMPETATVVES